MATNLLLEKKELKPLLYPVSEGISDEAAAEHAQLRRLACAHEMNDTLAT